MREGADVTIVSALKGVRDALAAAEALAGDGVDAEVIDLRTLRPLDLETVLGSVAKTNRLLVVEEGPRTGGWAAGLLGAVAEEGLHDLDDVWILATEETPIPYSPTLEDAFLPGAAEIAAAVRERAGRGRRLVSNFSPVFDHVTIRVSDREASERFYEHGPRRLGIEPTYTGEQFTEWDDFSLTAGDGWEPGHARAHVGFGASSRERVTSSGGSARTPATKRRRARPAARVRRRLLRRLPPRPGRQQHRGRAPRGRAPRGVDHLWIRVARRRGLQALLRDDRAARRLEPRHGHAGARRRSAATGLLLGRSQATT